MSHERDTTLMTSFCAVARGRKMSDNNFLDTLTTLGVAYVALHVWEEKSKKERDQRDEILARCKGITKEKLLEGRWQEEVRQHAEKERAKLIDAIGWIFSVTPRRAERYRQYINRYMCEENITQRQAIKKLAEFLKERGKRRRNLVRRWQVKKRAIKLPLTLKAFRIRSATKKPDNPRRLALKQQEREAYAKMWENF
jgi:hypothetical protein